MTPMHVALTQRRSPSRRGAALIIVVAALSVISILLVIITKQIVANRRLVDRRHHQLQAAWLARAGVEQAIARLLADPEKYNGESVELIPAGKIKIAVQRDPKAPDEIQVTCEARYPAAGSDPVAHSQFRHFRRVMEGKKIRLEPVMPP